MINEILVKNDITELESYFDNLPESIVVEIETMNVGGRGENKKFIIKDTDDNTIVIPFSPNFILYKEFSNNLYNNIYNSTAVVNNMVTFTHGNLFVDSRRRSTSNKVFVYYRVYNDYGSPTIPETMFLEGKFIIDLYKWKRKLEEIWED